jgi:hypothetical protein
MAGSDDPMGDAIAIRIVANELRQALEDAIYRGSHSSGVEALLKHQVCVDCGQMKEGHWKLHAFRYNDSSPRP